MSANDQGVMSTLWKSFCAWWKDNAGQWDLSHERSGIPSLGSNVNPDQHLSEMDLMVGPLGHDVPLPPSIDRRDRTDRRDAGNPLAF